MREIDNLISHTCSKLLTIHNSLILEDTDDIKEIKPIILTVIEKLKKITKQPVNKLKPTRSRSSSPCPCGCS